MRTVRKHFFVYMSDVQMIAHVVHMYTRKMFTHVLRMNTRKSKMFTYVLHMYTRQMLCMYTREMFTRVLRMHTRNFFTQMRNVDIRIPTSRSRFLSRGTSLQHTAKHCNTCGATCVIYMYITNARLTNV